MSTFNIEMLERATNEGFDEVKLSKEYQELRDKLFEVRKEGRKYIQTKRPIPHIEEMKAQKRISQIFQQFYTELIPVTYNVASAYHTIPEDTKLSLITQKLDEVISIYRPNEQKLSTFWSNALRSILNNEYDKEFNGKESIWQNIEAPKTEEGDELDDFETTYFYLGSKDEADALEFMNAARNSKIFTESELDIIEIISVYGAEKLTPITKTLISLHEVELQKYFDESLDVLFSEDRVQKESAFQDIKYIVEKKMNSIARKLTPEVIEKLTNRKVAV